MRRLSNGVLALLMLAVMAGGTAAAAEDIKEVLRRERQAIAALGELNGLALHCKEAEVVRRIKQSIIYGVPRLRDYGQMFDEATNEAYLEASSEGAACPDTATLESRVSDAVSHMKKVFAEE